MKLREWLKKWKLDTVRLSFSGLEAELKFNDTDRRAAWELYIELLTRVAANPLQEDSGDESQALQSLREIFGITRRVLKEYGPDAAEFTKIAILVLNFIIRPFTSKWHKKSLEGAFNDPEEVVVFRKELTLLQSQLVNYMKALADIAGVQDFTGLGE